MHEIIIPGETTQAEIILGLQEGYDGPLHSTEEVVLFLERLNDAALTAGEHFVSFRVSETTIVHGHTSGRSQHEPSLVLTCTKSLVYDVGSTITEWKDLVAAYALKLAEHFRQFQVYIFYHPVEVAIVQKNM